MFIVPTILLVQLLKAFVKGEIYTEFHDRSDYVW